MPGVLVGNGEARESRIGYINGQVAAVENWDSLIGMSVRHTEHAVSHHMTGKEDGVLTHKFLFVTG